MRAEKDIPSGDVPPNSPTSIHIPIDRLIDLVRLLVISLVSRARKQAIFIIRVLKLVWIDFDVLTATGLGFSVLRKLLVADIANDKGDARNDLCRGPFSSRSNIRPCSESRGTTRWMVRSVRGSINTTAHPRPRPATYDAGAGIDKNASLLGLFDAILET